MIEIIEKPMTAGQIADAFQGPSAIAVDHSQRAQRARRRKAAQEMLVRRGLNKDSAVFITSSEVSDDSDLTDTPHSGPLPMVCEVVGHYAVDFIADRTHRLASADEIARFRVEQAERQAKCAEIESRNPANKNIHQTINYVMPPEVAKQQIAAVQAATADASSRGRRNAAE
jgi:hypothetical protein